MPRQFGLITILLVFMSQISGAAEFRAAEAKADITPQTSVELWGYSDRTGPATGTLDPLFAKIVVMDDGANRIALVTLDLGRTFGFESLDNIRQTATQKSGVQQVFFFASHTHSGPTIDDAYEAGKRPEWETQAIDKITSAIADAAGKLAPAKIGFGIGETLIGHNRRLINTDGSVTMLWRNASKMPTHPVDPRVGVIRIDSATGVPMAILVNYSCHPVVLGPANLEYSADYPGAMAKQVEENLDGHPLCLFLQGGAGDINPYYDKMTIGEDAVRLMRETGTQLGREVERVARAISTVTPAKPEIKHSLVTRQFKSRWNTEKIMSMLEKRLKPEMVARYRKYVSVPLDCPITSLLINDEIALMGMPGEPFVDFAIDFRSRAPIKNAFFVGYANGYAGYFPTIQAASAGGYGADSLGARAEIGAGEAMVDAAVVELYRLRGLTPTLPRELTITNPN